MSVLCFYLGQPTVKTWFKRKNTKINFFSEVVSYLEPVLPSSHYAYRYHIY